MKLRVRRVIAATTFGLLLAGMTLATAAAGASDLDAARAATARFNSMNQASKAGYGLLPEGLPLHECIMSLDGSAGMGFHYINGNLLDATLDPLNPEALIYAPDDNGQLRLVAVEYVSFQADWEAANGPAVLGTNWPSLLGEDMTLVPAPNRYEIPAFFELHAWIWEENPVGTFEDFNPDVSCD
jgi:hypothetical protein